MLFEPHSRVLGALLSANRTHCRLDLAQIIARHISELEPDNATPYVILSDIYLFSKKKDDEELVRTLKRLKGIKKRVKKKNAVEVIAYGGSSVGIEPTSYPLFLPRKRPRMYVASMYDMVTPFVICMVIWKFCAKGSNQKSSWYTSRSISGLNPNIGKRVKQNLRNDDNVSCGGFFNVFKKLVVDFSMLQRETEKLKTDIEKMRIELRKGIQELKPEKNFGDLKIALDLINEATKNFDDAYCIPRRMKGINALYPENEARKKSDIYSFGVVLLEILTGRLAYDSVYTKVNEKGIAPIARDRYKTKTIMEIVDHKIKEETDEHVFSLCKGPNKESLDMFLEIALRCAAETQAQRPTIEVVINQLKKALDSQENHKDNLKLSLEDIKLATKGFSQDNIIGHGDSWNVYKGATHSFHGDNIIAAKRLDKNSGQGDVEVLTEVATAKFMAELDILMEYKHLNVVGLVGYCDEEDEKSIVCEYASRGSLDKYLSDDSLTWVMRLKICIDIAVGLEFLHGTGSSQEMVIHRDISSSNILLFDDWKAKMTGFGLSVVCPTNQNVDYVIDNVTGTIGYCDPLHSKTGFLTQESDIFSLGAVLFDILCGKLSSEKLDDEYLYLPFLAKHHYHVGKLDKRERRPTAHEVVIQLKKALEFQEDYYVWEPKLPNDYKEIIQMSKCPNDYSTIKKEDLYNIFSKGILLQQDKVLLSFDGDGERNEMVSATMFSYIGSCPHELIYLRESRLFSPPDV
ncbi:kinase-like domain, phloem protein 2-like protein [Tanacetum coccineum]